MRNLIKNKKIIFIIAGIIVFVLLVTVLELRDNTNYSKDEPRGTVKVANTNGVYREVYKVYGGGVYGGDVRTVYLTDSLTFRKYVGKMFDHERIAVKCINQDLIAVLKLDLEKQRPQSVIDSTVYSLPNLKKEGKWE